MLFHQALKMDIFFPDTIEQKGPASDKLQLRYLTRTKTISQENQVQAAT